MNFNLPLLYLFWFVEYCQSSPPKKSPNLWHITSILVCCIFGTYSRVPNKIGGNLIIFWMFFSPTSSYLRLLVYQISSCFIIFIILVKTKKGNNLYIVFARKQTFSIHREVIIISRDFYALKNLYTYCTGYIRLYE